MSGVTVLIPAAGSGSRFGGAVPKQYQLLAGKPILERVIETVASHYDVIVAVAADRMQADRDRVRFVEGGATRQESVTRALAAAGDVELVAVHDAVRPFVRAEIFRAVVDAARVHGAAVPGAPVTDTIHRVRDGLIAETLDRTALVAAQTPQGFRASLLRDVLARAAREGIDATDEAGLVARYGFTVAVVRGDPMNVKITRREDLAMAEARFAEWSAS